MKNKSFLLLVLIVGLVSCKKENNKIHYGEVASQPNYCTSSTGFPFVIKYTSTTNQIDSFITTTLPIQYKFKDQRIKFEIRELNSQEERIACTYLFDIPKQLVIFNVSAN